MNNYLFAQEARFNPATFTPMTEETKPNLDAELATQAQLQVENTIRYRNNAKSSSSQPNFESNARLIDLNTVKKVKGGSFVAKDFVVPAPTPQDELLHKLGHYEDTKMQGISSSLEYVDPTEAKLQREQRIKCTITELASSGNRAFSNKRKSSTKNGKSVKRSNRRKDDFRRLLDGKDWEYYYDRWKFYMRLASGIYFFQSSSPNTAGQPSYGQLAKQNLANKQASTDSKAATSPSKSNGTAPQQNTLKSSNNEANVNS